jgi:hypothetical protein
MSILPSFVILSPDLVKAGHSLLIPLAVIQRGSDMTCSITAAVCLAIFVAGAEALNDDPS